MLTIVYTPKATTPNENIGRVFEHTNNVLSITYRPWWQTFLDLITEPLGTSWSFAGKCAVATACTRTPIDGQHGSASKSGCRQREFVGKFWRNFTWCRDAWFMFMILLGGSWKFYGILMMFSLPVQALFFCFFWTLKYVVFGCVEDVSNCCHCPCFLNFWPPNLWPHFPQRFTGAVVGAVGAVSAIGRAGANLKSTLVLWMRTKGRGRSWDRLLETTW